VQSYRTIRIINSQRLTSARINPEPSAVWVRGKIEEAGKLMAVIVDIIEGVDRGKYEMYQEEKNAAEKLVSDLEKGKSTLTTIWWVLR
jgi:hypothetical protein